MWKQASLFALVAAVAACSGDGSPNPVNGNQPADPSNPVEPPPEGVIIPEGIAGDLENVRWERGAAGDGDDRLIVTGITLDDSPIEGIYDRQPDEDVPGYIAFSKQDDRLDRIFIALAGESPDGSVRGYAVGDGGQFGYEHSGIFYERTGDYSPPDLDRVNGLVSYAGRYAAVTDLPDPEQNARMNPFGSDPANPLPVPPEAMPIQGRTIEGKVFMNVDFADNALNGVIYDRTFSNGERIGDEGYLVLVEGQIDENGNFGGNVLQNLTTQDPAEPNRGIGDFAGTFGGENAAGMVGAFTADNHLRQRSADNPEEFEDIPDSTERGIWTIPRCGEGSSDAVCGELNDIEGILPRQ